MEEVTLMEAPTELEIIEWAFDGGCFARCGCWVETDGHCGDHDQPSWMIVYGMI